MAMGGVSSRSPARPPPRRRGRPRILQGKAPLAGPRPDQQRPDLFFARCYGFALTVAFAFDSYEVFVDSKKLTSCSVSFAAAIHLAGFDTLYSASKPSSSSRRSARYFTYWLM